MGFICPECGKRHPATTGCASEPMQYTLRNYATAIRKPVELNEQELELLAKINKAFADYGSAHLFGTVPDDGDYIAREMTVDDFSKAIEIAKEAYKRDLLRWMLRIIQAQMEQIEGLKNQAG